MPHPPPPPPPPPATPSRVSVALVQSKSAVSSLRTTVVLGGLTLALVCAALSYVLCCRRRPTAPHLTSVVDEDAAEVGMGVMNGKEILE
jgi:hypothetical protein